MKKIGVNMDWFKSSRRKKTEDYEKGYLTRYKKGQKAKPKKKALKDKNSIETEFHETNQGTKVETRKEEPESLSTKFESVKQEYNITIKNLMNTKRELKNMKEVVQKLNNEYDDITYVDSAQVFCDGGRGELGHPGVYLNIGEKPQIVCPYCSRKFAMIDNSSNNQRGGSEH